MPDVLTKFKKGDFVRCLYEFMDFYIYLYDEEYPYMPFYGIIVDLVPEEGWFEMETVYKVYCLDGRDRFFLEDELELV